MVNVQKCCINMVLDSPLIMATSENIQRHPRSQHHGLIQGFFARYSHSALSQFYCWEIMFYQGCDNTLNSQDETIHNTGFMRMKRDESCNTSFEKSSMMKFMTGKIPLFD